VICRNIGAPLPRADGSFVPTGMLFDATADEMKRFAHKVVAEPGAILPPVIARPPRPDGWPMDIDPGRYLAVLPDGPLAELARQFVAAPEEAPALAQGTPPADLGAEDECL